MDEEIHFPDVFHSIIIFYSTEFTQICVMVFTKMWIQAVGYTAVTGTTWIMLLVSNYSCLTQFYWNGLHGHHLGACSETEYYKSLSDTVKFNRIIIIWYKLEGWFIKMENYGYLVVTGEWQILAASAFERCGFNFSFSLYLMPGLRGFRISSAHLEMNLVHQAQAIRLSLATKLFVWLTHSFKKVFHL
jgi:hypothetical protein